MSFERDGIVRRGIRSGWQRSERITSALTKAMARLRFGRAIHFGTGVILLPGVRFEIYDGGTIEIGANTLIGPRAILIASSGTLAIGADSFVYFGSVIVARNSIAIGRGALIGEHVTIRDHDHAHDDPTRPIRLQGMVESPIVIGDNVWLAAKVTVTRGVTIPDGTIVGANSVVTRPLEQPGIYGGIPARLIARLEQGS